MYTVVLGTPNGQIERTLVGGYRSHARPANPQLLQAVARTSGGEFFTAADPDELKAVYEQLGSQLGTRKEEREISDYFSAGAAGFLLVGAMLSTALVPEGPVRKALVLPACVRPRSLRAWGRRARRTSAAG